MTITVGELKAALAELPDDLCIFSADKRGYQGPYKRPWIWEIGAPFHQGVEKLQVLQNNVEPWAILPVGGPGLVTPQEKIDKAPKRNWWRLAR